ncbi:ATP-binding protein [Shewanella marinintestina]|uniref:hybrid sensor histidine kinase/response regulator n=1 Tax=Shewanella marinintestina TaxID=190305 RepID=UPI00200D12FB|nr:ATP-binding protein [Shewanella marinintestina]
MKQKRLSYLVLIIGLTLTTASTFATWKRMQNGFYSFYQNKTKQIFESSREIFKQQGMVIDALRILFETRNPISHENFSLFSSEILKSKSAIAFTIGKHLKPNFISDTGYEDTINKKQFNSLFGGETSFKFDNYTTTIIPLEHFKDPYLIYAVPNSLIQKKLEQNQNFCLRLTIGSQTLSNQACKDYKNRHLSTLINFDSYKIMTLPKYGTNFLIYVNYIPAEDELFTVLTLLAYCSLLGIGISLLMAIYVHNLLNKQTVQRENNAKLAALSNLNHEIRTPINAVVGYANLLKTISYSRKKEQEIVDNLIWSSNLVNSVAQNALSYSKASAECLSLCYEELDLKAFLGKLNDYYQSFIDVHKKKIVMQLSSPIPQFIQLDSTQFYQLITNFINNAFKHSTGNRVIYDIKILPCDTDDSAKLGYIRVSIKDFGNGMVKSAEEAFRNPFTTYSSVKQAEPSIGIGLYTSKSVIESIGGKIKIRSQPGKGTLVIFHFPYKVSNKHHLTNTKANVVSKVDHTKPHQTHTYPLRVNNKNRVVLLVEDNRFDLAVCKSLLESNGYKVITAVNEAESITALQRYMSKYGYSEQSPLIVLMDYILGESNGLTLIEKLKQYGYNSLRYFILSANSENEIPKLSLSNDIVFLQKPLKVNQLEQYLALS